MARTFLIFVLCLVLACQNVFGVPMSEKQFKAAMKMVRNVCQPKNKVTDEQIDAMHNGNWNLEKNVQCYVYCGLKMYKLMKEDNSFDTDAFIKTLQNQGPLFMRDAGIATVEKCRGASKTLSDKCISAYETAKCIYEDNPENYFLP